MKIIVKISLCLITISFISCFDVDAPKPVGPIPTAAQIKWQKMEFYGFVHFSLNTFTDDEWGFGDKPPKLFNPSQLDTRQWARIAKEAGMKGLILTDKHHDGFCLWPSKYTDYSVKNSPWKNGRGDVVKELADACREFGLKMGVYLSPWDRHSDMYGKPEYITYFRNQLTELLTNYGDVFEIWFDGANGGDGYYGGANETRVVDKKSYYDWDGTINLIRKLQPNCIIWSDAGPDARWIGNEHGFAYETTWSPLLRDSVYGGMPNYGSEYAMGQENGTHWVPAEADVSIRPSWYYHKSEDDQVKSLRQLLDIYYKSVGQNSTLLLNLPVDRRGLVNERDERQLKRFAAQLKAEFLNNLAVNANFSASNIRGESLIYGPKKAFDGNENSYWATDDTIKKASLLIDFGKPTEFNRFLIQEYIPLGQRIMKFHLEAEINGKWTTIAQKTTIGYKRILRLDNTKATKIKLVIEEAKAAPLISNIEIYKAPIIVKRPKATRTKEGFVNLIPSCKGIQIFYSLDGSEPTKHSNEFTSEFIVDKPTIIKAISYDSKTRRYSDVLTVYYDISKEIWKITTGQNDICPRYAIDDNIQSDWKVGAKTLADCKIDFGKPLTIKGFTYTPAQNESVSTGITKYRFLGSKNGKDWKLLSQGEFSNIQANPIQQKIIFGSTVTARYVKLIADKLVNDSKIVTIAEIGVITK